MPLARAALAVLALAFAAPAAAQTHTMEIWRLSGDAAFSLRTTYTPSAHGMHARMELDRIVVDGTHGAGAASPPAIAAETNHGARAGAARVVLDGDPVMSTLVPYSTQAAAVVSWTAGPHAAVAVTLVDFSLPANDAHAVRRVVLPRPGGNGTSPFAAVGCVHDGIVVIWNEISDTAMGGGATGYAARVALDGTVAEAPHVVAIPWSLAALAPNAAGGYWLAVRYDGQGPGQTHLCLVRLDAALNPQEHPWWASRATEIGDTQLVVTDAGPTLVYATHEGVLASAAHSGSWGQDPAPSRRLVAHGPFAAGTGAVPVGVLVPR